MHLALSFTENFAYQRGKVIVEKLKKLIPKQQFEIPIQAAIGNKIISRETIKQCVKTYLQNVTVGILVGNVNY